MYLYSKWSVAHGRPDQIEEFTEAWTGGSVEPVTDESGARAWPQTLDFSESTDSEWVQSEQSGRRWTGLVVLPDTDSAGDYLVGVLAVTQALSVALTEQATQLLSVADLSPEPVSYSIRTLLGPEAAKGGVTARSVRLRNDLGEIVLLSQGSEQLRSQLDQVTGEPTGVTVEVNGARLSVYGDDSLVFTEPRSALEAAAAVRSIGFALEVAATMGA